GADDIAVFVTGSSDERSSDFDAWASVVAAADDRIGAGTSNVPWAALVAAGTDAGGFSRLAALLKAGPYSLRAGALPIVEQVPSSPRMIGTELERVVWPIIVEGRSDGYDSS